jgi:hypothetical protein
MQRTSLVVTPLARRASGIPTAQAGKRRADCVPPLIADVRPHIRFTAALDFQEEHHGQIPDRFSKRGNGCAR